MFTNELSLDQQTFAEDHHSLIWAFLNKNKLPYNDYYDVVVFGYLRAVQQYCTRPDLRERYSFATIAWRKMKDDLAKHFKKENRPSRKAVLVFLDSPAFGDDVCSMHDIVPGPDASFESVNAGTLWNQISDLLNKEQAEALRLRLDGYTDR
jgi:hypothetical protein